MFIGPNLHFTEGNRWYLRVGADFAAVTESASQGVVPQYRFLGSVEGNF